MDYSFQISLAFLLILVLALPFAATREFRFYKEVKAAMTSDKPNGFVFQKSRWDVLWLIIAPIPIVLTSRMKVNTISLVIFAIFALFFILRLVINKMVIIADDNGIRSTDGYLKIKPFDMTGIRISDHEVAIHTEKRVNRHRFMRERLRGKQWPEFQGAIAQYASQFDHIKVERV